MEKTYQLGVTMLTLVAGATPTMVVPGKGINGWQVSRQSGGTLAIANGYGFSSANSYVLGSSQILDINGPANFFLAAGGATTIVGLMAKYSAGYSLFPS